MNRRQALERAACAVIGSSIVSNSAGQNSPVNQPSSGMRAVKNNRIKQSVARWCYKSFSVEQLCQAASDIGLHGIDLLTADEWAIARSHNLTCAIGYTDARSITDGINDKANHEFIVKSFERTLPLAARAGVPNLITFFGNRKNIDSRAGFDNCVTALKRIKPLAESENVTVCIELLNSKIDHKDYQGDSTKFGVEVIKAVASPRVKLLYDIYHLQIMEGDVIRTIRDNHQHIAHYHTGGVPGRHEIDATQELNYPAIMQAIHLTGFTGFVAHEFLPQRSPVASLREAAVLCDI